MNSMNNKFKVFPREFQLINDDIKKFVTYQNQKTINFYRDFNVGLEISLEEFDFLTHQYTDNKIVAKITYIEQSGYLFIIGFEKI